MSLVSEFPDFNLKRKYRPGKNKQHCDYLSQNSVEDKFLSDTEDNIKIFVNSVSNEEKNWLTVTAKRPEILEPYLNVKTDIEIIKVVSEPMKYEQRNGKTISPIFEVFVTKPIL